jgi:hypothetical protein
LRVRVRTVGRLPNRISLFQQNLNTRTDPLLLHEGKGQRRLVSRVHAGAQRERIFCCDEDYAHFLELVHERAQVRARGFAHKVGVAEHATEQIQAHPVFLDRYPCGFLRSARRNASISRFSGAQ